jgi:uncharacterized protein (TIGR02996 family)
MTQAAFEERLELNPADWTTRIIYADWMEEQGDHIAARGQRWMARHKKRPYWDCRSKTWDWYYGKNLGSWDSVIPINLLDKLRGWVRSGRSYQEYSTRIAAEAALAQALEEIRLEEAANQPYFATPLS